MVVILLRYYILRGYFILKTIFAILWQYKHILECKGENILHNYGTQKYLKKKYIAIVFAKKNILTHVIVVKEKNPEFQNDSHSGWTTRWNGDDFFLMEWKYDSQL